MAPGDPYFLRHLDSAEDIEQNTEFAMYLRALFNHPSVIRDSGSPETVGASEPDPFYLEEALVDAAPWEGYTAYDPYCAFRINRETPFKRSPPVSGKFSRPSSSSKADKQSPSQTGFEQYRRRGHLPRHRQFANSSFDQRLDSVNSTEFAPTPDLTPSSSLTSLCSVAGRLQAMLGEVNRIFHPTRERKHSQSDLLKGKKSMSPTPTMAQPVSGDFGCENPTMCSRKSTPVCTCRLMKPLPNTPNKGNPNDGPDERTSLEMGMSSLTDMTDRLLDNGLFPPTDDDASPAVPAPNLPVSTRPAPACAAGPISMSEVPIERSVWEPESDDESDSFSPKALSKKPIETLRKVRSKMQLRGVKSGTNLNLNLNRESQGEEGEDEEEEIIERHYYPVSGGSNSSGSGSGSSNNSVVAPPRDASLEATGSKPPSVANSSQDAARPTVQEKLLTACSPKPSIQALRDRLRDDDSDDDPSTPPVVAGESQTAATWPWQRNYRMEVHSPSPTPTSAPTCYDNAQKVRSSLIASEPSFFKKVLRPLRELNCYKRI